jgi:hypothetical protein
MPVTIDQIDTEVEPPPSPGALPVPNDKATPQSEALARRQSDLLHRLAARAARLQAD